ncbi:MAG: ATP-binding cassette domain-containing protein, partial [Lachnospiraceae bacterium]|nr:ATP-binding cassette domain-containing protein [Lachnospiraceae bacterium]
MAKELLQVKGLKVKVDEKEILHGIDLKIGAGETHVIMGPNGAGKSTLGSALMGDPRYEVTKGTVLFGGEDITGESADKIAKLGMFLSFQNPVEVPGITLSNFI